MYCKYTYKDYEDAYYSNNAYMCREIGTELLQKMGTKEAKKLLKKLISIDLDKNDEQELKKRAKILLDVKLWLMVNE